MTQASLYRCLYCGKELSSFNCGCGGDKTIVWHKDRREKLKRIRELNKEREND